MARALSRRCVGSRLACLAALIAAVVLFGGGTAAHALVVEVTANGSTYIVTTDTGQTLYSGSSFTAALQASTGTGNRTINVRVGGRTSQQVRIFANIGRVFAAQFQANIDKSICRPLIDLSASLDRACERDVRNSPIAQNSRGCFMSQSERCNQPGKLRRTECGLELNAAERRFRAVL